MQRPPSCYTLRCRCCCLRQGCPFHRGDKGIEACSLSLALQALLQDLSGCLLALLDGRRGLDHRGR